MRPKCTRFAVVWLVFATLHGFAIAQSGQLWGMAETYRRNQEELRSYRWKSRTEVSIGGRVKETTLSAVRYDTDGNLETTPIEAKQADNARGALRKRKAKKQRQEATELSQDLQDLIRSYTEFTPRQMHSVFARAGEWRGQEDTTRVQARDVVRPGDTMDLWIDSRTGQLRKVEIRTSIQGQFVNVVTDFSDLPGGPTYPERFRVETQTKGKPMVIRTENFDCVRDLP